MRTGLNSDRAPRPTRSGGGYAFMPNQIIGAMLSKVVTPDQPGVLSPAETRQVRQLFVDPRDQGAGHRDDGATRSLASGMPALLAEPCDERRSSLLQRSKLRAELAQFAIEAR
ncbi:MAG: hypothetical protein ACREQM_23440 [Candidatus Dormibacteraceae bacterium]